MRYFKDASGCRSIIDERFLEFVQYAVILVLDLNLDAVGVIEHPSGAFKRAGTAHDMGPESHALYDAIEMYPTCPHVPPFM